MSNADRLKVAFPVEQDGDHFVERMHAIQVGPNQFVLDNSPFYSYGISNGDTFRADLRDGDVVFSEVLRRGGHSTYRVKLPEGYSHAHFLRHWQPLEELGCSYEGSSANTKRIYAIDVPPGVDVFKVYGILEKGEEQRLWEFDEGYYFDPEVEGKQGSK